MNNKNTAHHKSSIAIIGMGCIFPKSRNLKEFWHLLYHGIDAIEDIPADTHWKINDYFDKDPSKPDHTYCRRGGFLPSITFDPLSYGIPPNNLEATDTSQLLGLEVAKMALEDAGYPMGHPFLEQKKVNVILGVTGTQELVIPLGARLGHPIWKKALEDSGISEVKKAEIIQRIQGGYVEWQENSFPGLLGNVVAGRIANRMNLSGTNTVADAACASSLSAIHTAVMELLSGKCDMSITGGVDALNDIFMHMCFSKTGVLSHTSDARPFSKDADGTVLGEGIGMLVLKRYEDAEKDKDKIYAVIKGVGTSSDGRTSAIYAPDSKGQLKALNEAYRDAGIDPSTVELIEAHGTGTRVGDKVEFEALKLCFDPCSKKNQTAVGSVKSMIGHTKAAAGAAGMIKAVLSLYNKVIPPTLKAIEPDPELKIENSSFYLNSESKPWIPSSHPRRSGVSAFGFGGSNFHVVLEEYHPLKTHVSWDGSVQIIAFSSDTKNELLRQVNNFKTGLTPFDDALHIKQTIAQKAHESRLNFSVNRNYRLLTVYKADEDIFKLLDHALKRIETEQSHSGVYFSSGMKKGKLGFLFPGQGSQYTGMGKDLVSLFPEAIETLKEASRFFLNENMTSGHKALQDYIYPPPAHIQSKDVSEDQLRETDIAQPAIGAISCAMMKVLKRFGISPEITCGHSFGELCALYSAEWMDETTFLQLAATRGKYMASAKSMNGDPGGMLAVKASLAEIEVLIKEENLDLVLANKNCQTQGVLSGSSDEILRAKKICKQKKLRAVKLPVAAAFHSRLIENAVAPFKASLSSMSFNPTRIEVFSNTTGIPYDKKEYEIKRILGNQLLNPVNFLGNIENIFEKEVTTFIEVGPKSVLTDLTKAILKEKDITAISLDASCGKKSGIEDLAHVLCLIASKGFPIDLTPWEDPIKKIDPKRMKIKPAGRVTLPKSDPVVPTAQKPQTSHRSTSKGTDMTSEQKQNNGGNISFPAFEAMKMVEKGLEAMQQLQAQTARAHEKFLETQVQASKTLASMLEQTRNIAFSPSTPIIVGDSQVECHSRHTNAPMIEPESFAETLPKIEIDTLISENSAGKQSEKTSRQDEPAHNNSNNDGIEQILFEIVSRLTGFPSEMLEAKMDIESDLGIDSIKKVEIISELEKQLPGCEGITTESMGSVRTLQDICHAISHTTSPGKKTIATVPDTKSKTSNTPIKGLYQTVSTILMNTISELTGFPAEMLESSMNLESDLGIDSIKRVEILSRLEQELDHIERISSDDIGKLKTIREIIDFLSKDEQTASVESIHRMPQPVAESLTISEPADPDMMLTRKIVSLKKYPTNEIRFYNGAKIELPAKKKIYITKDSSKISEQFQIEFQKIGLPSVLIDFENGKIPDLPDAAGIVIVPDAFNKKTPSNGIDFLKSAFLLARKNAGYLMESGKEKGAFLAVVSFLGGGFGFGNTDFTTDPVYGGLAGLAKTAHLEWKNVLCRALDLPDSKEKAIQNAEAAVSLMMTQGSVEMGLDGDFCNIPNLVEQDIDEQNANLDQNDVVIITGGARGVTAACAIQIAKKYSPVLILIGRTPLTTSEPEWAKNLDDPAMLKKAILTNKFNGQTAKPVDIEKEYQKIVSGREIWDNIECMQQYGSTVRYFSTDIRDKIEVDAVFKAVRKEFSRITTIVHGAGVIDDKLIVEKQIEPFTRVLETKIKGLEVLLSLSKEDKLKYFILFSSIAARTGNQGQCDYVMANEVLNKTSQKLSRNNPSCKYLSINWGPWEGGMVNDSLKKDFLKKGVALIPLKKGAKQLLIEMGNKNGTDPEVIIGGLVSETEKKSKEPKLSTAMTFTFGKKSVPVLQSHKINGEPVVPFALIMECHAKASEKNNPGLVFSGMDDMRLLKGIKPGNEEIQVHVNLGKCRPEGTKWVIPSNTASENHDGNAFIHSSCSIILRDSRPTPPILSKSAFMELRPYSLSTEEAYSCVLFHGTELQSIKSINGYSEKGIEITTTLSPVPDQWFKNYPGSKWIIDPMMLDAAFQAAILWSHEKTGQVCLPSFIANLRLYSSFNDLKGDVRILFIVNEEKRSKITGYFTFLNEDNIVVASITGFEAITDPSLLNKFKKKPLFSRDSILAFAEGQPSEAFGEKYQIFDHEREIARLPRPPYFFMDRVMTADHPQWEMHPGGWIETEYDIPQDAWYFKANRTDTLPFCILLEIALQPCGWLAAYAGSALESKDRLHFRNLGGKALFLKSLSRNSGTVTIRTRMKEVSKAGGMIIQDFDFEVLKNNDMVYKGTTNFGFFTKKTFSNQVGIRNSKFINTEFPVESINPIYYEFQNDAPLTPDDLSDDKNTDMPSKALRMIDKIEVFDLNAGFYGKGYIRANKKVDPGEWFFHAHFYQDPVCPGSLGVESILQTLRFFLLKKFNIDSNQYEYGILNGQSHEWNYRGQIIPENSKIQIHTHIKDASLADNGYIVNADGALSVDGICIYELKNFGIIFKRVTNPKKNNRSKNDEKQISRNRI
ncbi:MAG: SDR family NAD(P)-dependent oxidoreductase [Desulfobacula sp.]|jgi:acyl transferase domain-containing protein/3-hydroxymyristoyl/3-hydroxydecanoyl-(acyl carrier protein) dehydratase/NAD(P)-dependent dehydrogenase (short-subunit alcohol dehydrogenase family)